jgi:hypothetical protein
MLPPRLGRQYLRGHFVLLPCVTDHRLWHKKYKCPKHSSRAISAVFFSSLTVYVCTVHSTIKQAASSRSGVLINELRREELCPTFSSRIERSAVAEAWKRMDLVCLPATLHTRVFSSAKDLQYLTNFRFFPNFWARFGLDRQWCKSEA